MQQPETNPSNQSAAGERPPQTEQQPPSQTESAPEQTRPQPEATPNRQEQAPTTDQSVSLPQVQPPKTDDVAYPDSQTRSQPDPSDNTTPLIADDVDVIEKEWVDKAKQIIEENKHDPHELEEAFERLQIEYHKKRYGRNIKYHR